MTLNVEVGKRFRCKNDDEYTIESDVFLGLVGMRVFRAPNTFIHWSHDGLAYSGGIGYGRVEREVWFDFVEEVPIAPANPSIVDEAVSIVNGARRKAYGTPEDNFERIARFWNAYFQNTGRDVSLTAADVSPMMRLMKEARLTETPNHRDSHVDLIGYTLTGARINGVDGA